MDGFKMHDMGKERQVGNLCTGPSDGGEKEVEVYYPTTYVTSKEIPEIADYEVGDECYKHALVHIKGKREREENGEIFVEVELEIVRMGIAPAGSTKKRAEMGVSRDNYNKMKGKMGAY